MDDILLNINIIIKFITFSEKYMKLIPASVTRKFSQEIFCREIAAMSSRKKPIIKKEVLPNELCSLLHYFNENDHVSDIKLIRQKLLNWFHANKRELPWRTIAARTDIEDDIKGYSVWVSEIMLQQTQVATVIGNF